MTGDYLIPIQVPIWLEGERTFVASEWHRALFLLRDSFKGRFERFHLIAPYRRVTADAPRPALEPLGEDERDGFRLSPVFPLDARAREYWLTHRRVWRAALRQALGEAAVAHVTMTELYKPISLDALRLALGAGVPTVFVQDTDTIVQRQALAALGEERNGARERIYSALYEAFQRNAVARADLSLLKGQALMTRYGPHAANARCFQDTSYLLSEIVPKAQILSRLARPETGTRFVYCGRLIHRKGCDVSIRIVKALVDAGHDVRFDLIGDGPERGALQALIEASGLTDRVRLLGEMPYGPELLRRLADYDALLFTPVAEDTPRMIFDGYAAGLPLVASDIPYVRERATEDGAALTLPFNDVAGSAAAISELLKAPRRLAELTRAACRAADRNASDRWYQRRADWTLEMLERASARR
jgi:glycosyltransferase involved in cell wall biosynthesis